jgi:aminopeptidase
VCVTGTLTGRYVRGSRTRHVFDEAHPMATYLAAVHVGQYERAVLAEAPVRQVVVWRMSLSQNRGTVLRAML